MVLQVKIPKGELFIRLIEKDCARRFKVPYLPFKKYLTEIQAQSVLNLTSLRLKHYVASSKVVHGVLFQDNTFLVHPHGLIKLTKTKFKKLLRSELSVLD